MRDNIGVFVLSTHYLRNRVHPCEIVRINSVNDQLAYSRARDNVGTVPRGVNDPNGPNIEG